ncbi:MAG: fused MFS/spermidine synthase [Myxococcota bacterium]
MARSRAVLGVYGLVFVSGAAGLAYEVSWARQLGLVFGQTARASAVVLAAYFFGMALGYALAGRLSRRITRPLQGFALAEFAAGAWAFAVPGCLSLLPEAVSTGPARFIAVVLLLLPGTTALGASLPFVAQAIAGDGGGTTRVARMYAVNLIGAVVGVVGSSLWLLAPLGVVATSWAAACLSISVGLVAWLLRERFVQPQAAPSASEDPADRVGLWMLASAISGFGTLAAQVLYARLFALVFHNSTYTFAAILLVVLVALALASFAGSVLMGRVDARRLLVVSALLAAVAIPLSVALFVDVQGLRAFSRGETFYAYMLGATGMVAAVVLVPMLAMGIILPLSWTLAGADSRPGSIVGRLTTANTIAAAAGAISASFVLLPAVGLWWSFAVVASTYLMLAAVVSLTRAQKRWRGAAAVLVCGVLVAGLTRSFSKVDGVRSDEMLVVRFSGAYGWTDVTRDKDSDNLHIRQNVHYGLGSKRSGAMELRQGYFPLLLHDDPQTVAFIGLATGTTASAALDHPDVDRITVMELVPEVVEAARYFADVNGGLLDDPRVRLIVDDGRRVLGSEDARYDVIVSDLFVPWESKTGYLYTVEHFEAVRARLSEDGVFCLWLPGWQIGPAEFEIIAASLGEVFEHVAIWQLSRHGRRPLFALVGVDDKRHLVRAELDAQFEHRRAPPVSRDFALRHADDVVAWYVGDWTPVSGVPLNTDEHPIIEFTAPKSHKTRGARFSRKSLFRFYDARLSTLERGAFTFDPPATPDEVRRPR